jgi:hypothetical protein
MSDPLVNKWRMKGRASLWKNPRKTEKPWNFSADDRGAESLAELLQLMISAEDSSTASIPLNRPDVTADWGLGVRLTFAQHLTIHSRRNPELPEQWGLSGSPHAVNLEMGPSRVAELAKAVGDLRKGGGDYRIGMDETPLWIWWWVDKAPGV